MRYEGPIYRPPSEADSLLIQATVGCPHNKCTFCMVYKKGPPFRVRPVREIEEDLDQAGRVYGPGVRTLFFPAGNTIAMPTDDLANICAYAHSIFPKLERITTYGSSRYVHRKGKDDLRKLKENGLLRIHVGLESGDDDVLRRIKKGTDSVEQTQAGLWVKEAGIELSEYVILGIGGKERTKEHAEATARVLSAINPDFIRLRTFLPKVNTLLLHQIKKGQFQILSPHEVLRETMQIIENLDVTSQITSDHYTNYVDIHGRLPDDRKEMLKVLDEAMKRDESSFRPVYIGTQ
ncbi:MAG: radical SAM protein [Deltaproteobacteria bacterium]|nr:radical SAM protein [Deltaproteobacteria bacterium]MBW2033725.1 radical SAM protein [Deltaproteobacteria bacterium]MBW2167797.1 radical SAM protein [Deltaproteobacteria bacterium]